MIYDYLIAIGRWQPFHSGHYHVIKDALKKSKDVILILGSHMSPRTSKNPYTTQERIEIIKTCFTSTELSRIHFAAQYDHPYNDDKWIAGIQACVNTITLKRFTPEPIKIGIIGYNKDHSSYYLKKFPAWDLIEINPYKVDGDILNAIDLRNGIFINGWQPIYDKYKVNEFHKIKICEYSENIWKQINDELKHIQLYKKQWENSPYPPTFVTVDAVVTQSGHVLLVERGAQPGKGLWALPGGFLNPHETMKEGAIRELYEETKIDVPKPVLNGSIVSHEIFDHPERSLRGRTITCAYHFKLVDREELPKIKGSDDAKKAFWVSFADIVKNRDKLFEDHGSILEKFIGL